MMKLTIRQREVLTKMNEGWTLCFSATLGVTIANNVMVELVAKRTSNVLKRDGYIIWKDIGIYAITDKGREVIR